MANPYCTVAQFEMLYDSRTTRQLSGDANARQGAVANIQFILDMQAGELESALAGRYDLPTIQALNPMPAILTKWVAVTANGRMWARRTESPKGVSPDDQWAANWMKQLLSGIVSIPGVDHATAPALQDSDFNDGRSRFDTVFGTYPSSTGPSKGL